MFLIVTCGVAFNNGSASTHTCEKSSNEVVNLCSDTWQTKNFKVQIQILLVGLRNRGACVTTSKCLKPPPHILKNPARSTKSMPRRSPAKAVDDASGKKPGYIYCHILWDLILHKCRPKLGRFVREIQGKRGFAIQIAPKNQKKVKLAGKR